MAEAQVEAKAGHTPGPWAIRGGNQIGHTEPDGFCCLASVSGHAKNAANARLIAAAPDLLAAMKAVATWCHSGHGCFPAAQCGMCKPIFAAIAKATGDAS